jgi:Flp pilus assembly protein TadD
LGALAFAEKKLTDAEAIFRRLRKEHPDNIEATAGLSQVLFAQKRSEEALATLREHVTAHPQSSRVRYLLATAAMRSQRFDLAVENYRAVLKSNPDQPAMVIELARALFGLRDFVEAEKVLKPVLERDARNAAAHALLATTLEQTGQLDRAKLHYQKAVDLQIEEPTVYNNLAWLIAETGGDLELAQRLSTKAVQRAAHRADYKDTLAWVYLKKNEVPAALHIWKQLVASDGKHAIYRYHYALALAKSGNAPAARLQLKQALANAPAGPVRHEITKILQNI